MTIEWAWKKLEQMSSLQFHEIAAARQAVFVVEQQCAYLDLDGLDGDAWHLCGTTEDGLAAYLRLLPPARAGAKPSIGRVMILPPHRGGGLGRVLMVQGIEGARRYFPGQGLRVSAQSHLESFYQGLGFVSSTRRYLEDGIPHVDMFLDDAEETSSEQ